MSRHNRCIGILLLGWSLACTGGLTSEDTDDAAVDVPEPTPIEAPVEPETPTEIVYAALPAVPEGAETWLGLGTVSEFDSDAYWIPAHPTAEVVVFAGEGFWEEVPIGARFAGLHDQGRVELVFQGVAAHAYGCDGNTAEFALFEGDMRPSGVVWFADPDNKRPTKAVSTSEVLTTKTERQWKVGPAKAKLVRMADMEAQFTVSRGAKQGYKETVEKYTMDGMDAVPIDLTSDSEVGMPYPELFVMSGKSIWLVSRSHGYEGTGWDVVELTGGKGKSRGSWMSAYYCAF